MEEIPEMRLMDWKFIESVGNVKKTISEIQKEINPKNGIYQVQRIFKKLNNLGLLRTKKVGRIRFIELNTNGKYFLEFYKKMRKRK
jgi:predicted transcriptional regulator